MISNFRPNAPILANCTTEKTARMLALNYGIYTCIVPLMDDTDELVDLVVEKTKEFFSLKTNDRIVVTGGLPGIGNERITNFLKMETIE